MEQGHTCLDSNNRGVCQTLPKKMLILKALTKRFSFVFHMNTRANIYQKIYISLRVYFSRIRSSWWLVCKNKTKSNSFKVLKRIKPLFILSFAKRRKREEENVEHENCRSCSAKLLWIYEYDLLALLLFLKQSSSSHIGTWGAEQRIASKDLLQAAVDVRIAMRPFLWSSR